MTHAGLHMRRSAGNACAIADDEDEDEDDDDNWVTKKNMYHTKDEMGAIWQEYFHQLGEYRDSGLHRSISNIEDDCKEGYTKPCIFSEIGSSSSALHKRSIIPRRDQQFIPPTHRPLTMDIWIPAKRDFIQNGRRYLDPWAPRDMNIAPKAFLEGSSSEISHFLNSNSKVTKRTLNDLGLISYHPIYPAFSYYTSRPESYQKDNLPFRSKSVTGIGSKHVPGRKSLIPSFNNFNNIPSSKSSVSGRRILPVPSTALSPVLRKSNLPTSLSQIDSLSRHIKDSDIFTYSRNPASILRSTNMISKKSNHMKSTTRKDYVPEKNHKRASLVREKIAIKNWKKFFVKRTHKHKIGSKTGMKKAKILHSQHKNTAKEHKKKNTEKPFKKKNHKTKKTSKRIMRKKNKTGKFNTEHKKQRGYGKTKSLSVHSKYAGRRHALRKGGFAKKAQLAKQESLLKRKSQIYKGTKHLRIYTHRSDNDRKRFTVPNHPTYDQPIISEESPIISPEEMKNIKNAVSDPSIRTNPDVSSMLRTILYSKDAITKLSTTAKHTVPYPPLNSIQNLFLASINQKKKDSTIFSQKKNKGIASIPAARDILQHHPVKTKELFFDDNGVLKHFTVPVEDNFMMDGDNVMGYSAVDDGAMHSNKYNNGDVKNVDTKHVDENGVSKSSIAMVGMVDEDADTRSSQHIRRELAKQILSMASKYKRYLQQARTKELQEDILLAQNPLSERLLVQRQRTVKKTDNALIWMRKNIETLMCNYERLAADEGGSSRTNACGNLANLYKEKYEDNRATVDLLTKELQKRVKNIQEDEMIIADATVRKQEEHPHNDHHVRYILDDNFPSNHKQENTEKDSGNKLEDNSDIQKSENRVPSPINKHNLLKNDIDVSEILALPSIANIVNSLVANQTSSQPEGKTEGIPHVESPKKKNAMDDIATLEALSDNMSMLSDESNITMDGIRKETIALKHSHDMMTNSNKPISGMTLLRLDKTIEAVDKNSGESSKSLASPIKLNESLSPRNDTVVKSTMKPKHEVLKGEAYTRTKDQPFVPFTDSYHKHVNLNRLTHGFANLLPDQLIKTMFNAVAERAHKRKLFGKKNPSDSSSDSSLSSDDLEKMVVHLLSYKDLYKNKGHMSQLINDMKILVGRAVKNKSSNAVAAKRNTNSTNVSENVLSEMKELNSKVNKSNYTDENDADQVLGELVKNATSLSNASTQSGVADSVKPDKASTQSGVADSVKPDKASTQSGAADSVKPDKASTQSGVADSVKPDKASTQSGVADSVKLDKASTQSGVADSVKPDNASTQLGVVDSVKPEALATQQTNNTSRSPMILITANNIEIVRENESSEGGHELKNSSIPISNSPITNTTQNVEIKSNSSSPVELNSAKPFNETFAKPFANNNVETSPTDKPIKKRPVKKLNRKPPHNTTTSTTSPSTATEIDDHMKVDAGKAIEDITRLLSSKGLDIQSSANKLRNDLISLLQDKDAEMQQTTFTNEVKVADEKNGGRDHDEDSYSSYASIGIPFLRNQTVGSTLTRDITKLFKQDNHPDVQSVSKDMTSFLLDPDATSEVKPDSNKVNSFFVVKAPEGPNVDRVHDTSKSSESAQIRSDTTGHILNRTYANVAPEKESTEHSMTRTLSDEVPILPPLDKSKMAVLAGAMSTMLNTSSTSANMPELLPDNSDMPQLVNAMAILQPDKRKEQKQSADPPDLIPDNRYRQKVSSSNDMITLLPDKDSAKASLPTLMPDKPVSSSTKDLVLTPDQTSSNVADKNKEVPALLPDRNTTQVAVPLLLPEKGSSIGSSLNGIPILLPNKGNISHLSSELPTLLPDKENVVHLSSGIVSLLPDKNGTGIGIKVPVLLPEGMMGKDTKILPVLLPNKNDTPANSIQVQPLLPDVGNGTRLSNEVTALLPDRNSSHLTVPVMYPEQDNSTKLNTKLTQSSIEKVADSNKNDSAKDSAGNETLALNPFSGNITVVSADGSLTYNNNHAIFTNDVSVQQNSKAGGNAKNSIEDRLKNITSLFLEKPTQDLNEISNSIIKSLDTTNATVDSNMKNGSEKNTFKSNEESDKLNENNQTTNSSATDLTMDNKNSNTSSNDSSHTGLTTVNSEAASLNKTLQAKLQEVSKENIDLLKDLVTVSKNKSGDLLNSSKGDTISKDNLIVGIGNLSIGNIKVSIGDVSAGNTNTKDSANLGGKSGKVFNQDRRRQVDEDAYSDIEETGIPVHLIEQDRIYNYKARHDVQESNKKKLEIGVSNFVHSRKRRNSSRPFNFDKPVQASGTKRELPRESSGSMTNRNKNGVKNGFQVHDITDLILNAVRDEADDKKSGSSEKPLQQDQDENHQRNGKFASLYSKQSNIILNHQQEKLGTEDIRSLQNRNQDRREREIKNDPQSSETRKGHQDPSENHKANPTAGLSSSTNGSQPLMINSTDKNKNKDKFSIDLKINLKNHSTNKSTNLAGIVTSDDLRKKLVEKISEIIPESVISDDKKKKLVEKIGEILPDTSLPRSDDVKTNSKRTNDSVHLPGSAAVDEKKKTHDNETALFDSLMIRKDKKPSSDKNDTTLPDVIATKVVLANYPVINGSVLPGSITKNETMNVVSKKNDSNDLYSSVITNSISEKLQEKNNTGLPGSIVPSDQPKEHDNGSTADVVNNGKTPVDGAKGSPKKADDKQQDVDKNDGNGYTKAEYNTAIDGSWNKLLMSINVNKTNNTNNSTASKQTIDTTNSKIGEEQLRKDVHDRLISFKKMIDENLESLAGMEKKSFQLDNKTSQDGGKDNNTKHYVLRNDTVVDKMLKIGTRNDTRKSGPDFSALPLNNPSPDHPNNMKTVDTTNKPSQNVSSSFEFHPIQNKSNSLMTKSPDNEKIENRNNADTIVDQVKNSLMTKSPDNEKIENRSNADTIVDQVKNSLMTKSPDNEKIENRSNADTIVDQVKNSLMTKSPDNEKIENRNNADTIVDQVKNSLMTKSPDNEKIENRNNADTIVDQVKNSLMTKSPDNEKIENRSNADTIVDQVKNSLMTKSPDNEKIENRNNADTIVDQVKNSLMTKSPDNEKIENRNNADTIVDQVKNSLMTKSPDNGKIENRSNSDTIVDQVNKLTQLIESMAAVPPPPTIAINSPILTEKSSSVPEEASKTAKDNSSIIKNISMIIGGGSAVAGNMSGNELTNKTNGTIITDSSPPESNKEMRNGLVDHANLNDVDIFKPSHHHHQWKPKPVNKSEKPHVAKLSRNATVLDTKWKNIRNNLKNLKININNGDGSKNSDALSDYFGTLQTGLNAELNDIRPENDGQIRRRKINKTLAVIAEMEGEIDQLITKYKQNEGFLKLNEAEVKKIRNLRKGKNSTASSAKQGRKVTFNKFKDQVAAAVKFLTKKKTKKESNEDNSAGLLRKEKEYEQRLGAFQKLASGLKDIEYTINPNTKEATVVRPASERKIENEIISLSDSLSEPRDLDRLKEMGGSRDDMRPPEGEVRAPESDMNMREYGNYGLDAFGHYQVSTPVLQNVLSQPELVNITNSVNAGDKVEQFRQAGVVNNIQRDEMRGALNDLRVETENGLKTVFKAAAKKQNKFMDNMEELETPVPMVPIDGKGRVIHRADDNSTLDDYSPGPPSGGDDDEDPEEEEEEEDREDPKDDYKEERGDDDGRPNIGREEERGFNIPSLGDKRMSVRRTQNAEKLKSLYDVSRFANKGVDYILR